MAEREQLDDRALVSRILEGDRDRFTELVKRYEKRVVNYVYRITHRYEEAHDLAQEIFVKVFMALDRYDPKYQFSTWLFRIAQNTAIDALRKKSVVEVPIAKPATQTDEESKDREFADTGVSPYRALKNKQLVQTLSNNAAPIEVAVELERDAATPSGYKWSSSRGPDLKLNDGTLTRADIEVRDMPLLSLVIPPLRQVLTPKS